MTFAVLRGIKEGCLTDVCLDHDQDEEGLGIASDWCLSVVDLAAKRGTIWLIAWLAAPMIQQHVPGVQKEKSRRISDFLFSSTVLCCNDILERLCGCRSGSGLACFYIHTYILEQLFSTSLLFR